jgi:hypothetical protein
MLEFFREDFGDVDAETLLNEDIDWFMRRAPPADQKAFIKLRKGHLDAIKRSSTRSIQAELSARLERLNESNKAQP